MPGRGTVRFRIASVRVSSRHTNRVTCKRHEATPPTEPADQDRSIKLGFRARCIAVTRAIGSNDGHFLCEVLDQEQGRWILHDANFDLHYEDDRPLSAVDVAQRIGDGASMKDCVRAGRGLPTKPARVVEAYRRLIRSGDCCRLISVWRRMDFMTDPSVAPGHHGSVAYLEPQWVWFDPSREETAMFPLRTGEKWFARS